MIMIIFLTVATYIIYSYNYENTQQLLQIMNQNTKY